MYHINPLTGQINKCTAAPGNCRYGPENHFNTFEEAQVHIDNDLNEKYPLLSNRHKAVYSEYANLENMSKAEVLKILETTEDDNLMFDVFESKLFVTEDVTYFKSLLKNENFPRFIIDHILNYPEEYQEGFQSLVANSPILTEEDLFLLANNTEYYQIQKEAMTNDNISSERIEKELTRYGNSLPGTPELYLVDNENCDEEISEFYREMFWAEYEEI